MFHTLDFFLQGGNLLRGHILHNEQGKRSLSKVIQKFILSDHRVHILGQVIEHIIVNSGAGHSQYGGNEQKHRYDYDCHTVLYHRS